MGHVDHGKTSILDRIRQSNVAAKEAGQITQSIGASQVFWKDKKITFLDTPGHEAFSKMRSRGAKVADLAVLVVAANDGVMPQTKESIRIIKEAKIPFIVAVNKIDLPEASVDKVKAQLSENEVFVEGYGGDVVSVPVSAKTGEGINQLLEMILLVAEMGELKADLKGPFKGVVIESKKERTRGISATVLVKNGTLKLGDQIIGEKISGKVKSMISDSGENVSVAEVSQPVSVSGWEGLPAVGVEVTLWRGKIDFNTITPKRKVTPLETEQKRLNLILRADSWGSLEAILGVLPPDVRVIQSDVGEICESDVLMAKTFSAIIFGFNLKISGSILKLAETEKVKVKTYRVIYDLLKEVEDEVLWMVDPMAGREVLGKAEVIAEFEIRGERIAGARVFSGRIDKADKSCILRSERIMAETSIKSMRHGKEEISQAGMNLEFGAIFSPPVDFQKGDVIISYINKA
jgi:translation initiation factor IF-2